MLLSFQKTGISRRTRAARRLRGVCNFQALRGALQNWRLPYYSNISAVYQEAALRIAVEEIGAPKSSTRLKMRPQSERDGSSTKQKLRSTKRDSPLTRGFQECSLESIAPGSSNGSDWRKLDCLLYSGIL